MVENPYFQFPLCALAFGPTVKNRLNAIIHYSLVVSGWKLFSKLSTEDQKRFLADARRMRRIPKGWDAQDCSHRGALYGAEIIGITFNDFLAGIELFRKMRDHINAFETAHGPDALVRIKKAWLFDTRDGRGIDYREFSVLCAIYSTIGNKPLAIITRKRIQRCALGYRTAEIMKAELPGRVDKAQSMTERQLRNTISALHRNKFFARSTVSRRLTYYSIRLDDEALRKKILERRTYPSFFHAVQAAQDQALTEAINRKRAKSSKPQPETPGDPQFQLSRRMHDE